jgi:hypothetical protein
MRATEAARAAATVATGCWGWCRFEILAFLFCANANNGALLTSSISCRLGRLALADSALASPYPSPPCDCLGLARPADAHTLARPPLRLASPRPNHGSVGFFRCVRPSFALFLSLSLSLSLSTFLRRPISAYTYAHTHPLTRKRHNQLCRRGKWLQGQSPARLPCPADCLALSTLTLTPTHACLSH